MCLCAFLHQVASRTAVGHQLTQHKLSLISSWYYLVSVTFASFVLHLIPRATSTMISWPHGDKGSRASPPARNALNWLITWQKGGIFPSACLSAVWLRNKREIKMHWAVYQFISREQSSQDDLYCRIGRLCYALFRVLLDSCLCCLCCTYVVLVYCVSIYDGICSLFRKKGGKWKVMSCLASVQCCWDSVKVLSPLIP